VTASTGIAAIHVNGTTLHSMAGLRQCTKMEDFEAMYHEPAGERWAGLEVLLIDEVSMVSAEMLSALESGARFIQGNKERAWGGIQLILCGDFHQLPPIFGGLKGKDAMPEARARMRCLCGCSFASVGV
jgi:ATP-dependent DNA helicase PIF1